MDFADALHLATARNCDGIATFDRNFIKAATRLGLATVAEP
jgi:predicted nucleic acid-binding protein